VTGSCTRAQLQWLRMRDGSLGWLGRLSLNRHMAAGQACRDFAEGESRGSAIMAAASVVAPGDEVLRMIRARADAARHLTPSSPAPPLREIGQVLSAAPTANGRRISQPTCADAAGAECSPVPLTPWALARALAAASALLVVIITPPFGLNARDPANQIDAVLDTVQEALAAPPPESVSEITRVSLDSSIEEIEKRLKCLDSQIEASIWDYSEGGEQCTDS